MRQRKTGKTLRASFYCLAIAATNQVFAEQQPPKRTGLWVTQKISESAANPAGFEAAIRGNPHLAGVCLTVGWKEIETEQIGRASCRERVEISVGGVRVKKIERK